ncbi:oxidoreductase [Coprinopsis sp. MPI-PUGE-AT-0042]|nr:oxidoreductase [Coprinopsis sp. MPI-PUGE-AT-0042]
MSEPRKVLFIGLSTKGWASYTSGPAITHPSLHSKYSLVAVATSSETSAREASAKWSSELGYPVGGLSDDTTNDKGHESDVDFVAISVKAPLHKEILFPYIRAEKDFFVEWPAGRTAQETREIAEEAKKHGVRSVIGFEGRHMPTIRKVKELLRSGKIGKILSSTVYGLTPREVQIYTPEQITSQFYISDPNNGATWFTIVVGHHLDTLTHVLGNISTISATSTTHYPTTTIIDDTTQKPTGETRVAPGHDHIALNGVLESGALMSAVWRVGVKATPGREIFRWEIEGEEGTIKLVATRHHGAMPTINPDLYVNGEKVEVPEDIPSVVEAYLQTFEEFSKGEEGNHATIEDAVRVRGLLDAIQKSLNTGETITVMQ